MNRRRLFLLAMGLLPLAAFAACTGPSVIIVERAAPSGNDDRIESGTPREAADSEAAEDAAPDGTWDIPAFEIPDVAIPVSDAAVRTDASARITDAAACETRTPCDCDDDGYAAIGCDAGTGLAANGQPLKPGDCDDLDPLRHPGQGLVAEVPPPGSTGDWNCNGVPEYFLSHPTFCGPVSPTTGKCDPSPGVRQPGDFQACGTPLEYAVCVPKQIVMSPHMCEPYTVGVVTQACK